MKHCSKYLLFCRIKSHTGLEQYKGEWHDINTFNIFFFTKKTTWMTKLTWVKVSLHVNTWINQKDAQGSTASLCSMCQCSYLEKYQPLHIGKHLYSKFWSVFFFLIVMVTSYGRHTGRPVERWFPPVAGLRDRLNTLHCP